MRKAGVPWLVSAGQWDCLTAGDSCSSDETCSPRLRTLRQCVAGGGSVKLGPGARNHCENAVNALLASPLHRCQCKRGMKKEKNCLSIYWSLKQSVIHESEAGMATVNHCLDAAKACNVDDTCQKLRTEYVSACIAPSGRAGACNRMRCNKALRKFFDRVPPDYTHELLFCPCSDTACSERRRQTIVPACSYEEREKHNCLAQLSSCEDDLVCKSRWAQFKHDCQPSELTASGCQQENYGACLIAYTGLIGTTITPNYLDNSTSNVGPWCSCAASGNHREQCYDFLMHFHDNTCLKNAILAFGNDSDSKSTANQPGAASPKTNNPNQPLATSTITTTTISINAESQQNIFHPQIPTQMNERDRLLSDSTLPLPDLYNNSPGCTDQRVTPFLLPALLIAFHF
ncbi:GDNF family receptor alpha-4 [Bagarius yarrelli]|uniref:GDNF family receptor alpha-4 n=1 Tax=Bagarius yarrelli TaxID=175774 RepID=A0A556V692_BAGYA|nr:GDNF family receptor alpha-4 [Bagarius yarrelli]